MDIFLCALIAFCAFCGFAFASVILGVAIAKAIIRWLDMDADKYDGDRTQFYL